LERGEKRKKTQRGGAVLVSNLNTREGKDRSIVVVLRIMTF